MENNKIKTKNELLKEMQLIADEVIKHKAEVEELLKVITKLEFDYFVLGEQIKQQ